MGSGESGSRAARVADSASSSDVSTRGGLGQKSIVLIVSTWAASGLGFLATVLVARRLGPEAVGILGFGFGMVGVLTALLIPSLNQVHQKRVAEGLDLGRCLGTVIVLQLGCQVLMFGVVLAASPWWPLVIPAGVPAQVLLFLLLSQTLAALADGLTTAFLGKEWAVAHGSTIVAGRAARFAATAVVLLWAPDVRWVAAAGAAEGAMELLVATRVLVGRGIRLRGPDAETLQAYWRYARPLLVTNPVSVLQDSLDRVLVARLAGLTPAGYYHVARVLWEVLGTLNAYPFQLLFSRLSRLFALRSEEGAVEARRLFASAVDKLLFMVVPVAFALWALREPVIRLLYGPAFLPAAPAVMIFSMAALAQAALNPYTFVVFALDQHARFIRLVPIRLAVYLAGMFVLVPLWAGTGAALVRLLLVLFPAWVYVRWARELGGTPFHPGIGVYLAGFLALIGVNEGTRAALGATGMSGTVGIPLAALTALAVYGLFLLVAYPSTRDNLRYARNLLDPRRVVAVLRPPSP